MPMRTQTLFIASILFVMSNAVMAAIQSKPIEYKAGDTSLKGYLAWDDSSSAKRPAVIVVPEWWGLEDYPRQRARQLAELGYVAFAIDMYGAGKTTEDPKQAGAWATEVKKDPNVEKARFDAAFDVLKQQPMVDPDKIAAIGYCFGGTMVLDMARMNRPVKGVVSFHGDLSTTAPAQKITAKVLACNGAADKFVPPEQVKAFEEEMKKAKADYKVINYPDAHHAFTNPKADSHHMDNVSYNEQADKQSWEAMKEFLANLFK